MSYEPLLPDSTACGAHGVARPFAVSRGRRDVDRTFALTGSSDDVEKGYLDPLEPATQRSGCSLPAASTARLS
jgi:hypothetical protein